MFVRDEDRKAFARRHCIYFLFTSDIVNLFPDSCVKMWDFLLHSSLPVSLVVQSCLFMTPWMVAHQAPLFMGLFGQEYWSGLPFPPPEDLPNPGIKFGSPTLYGILYYLSHQGSTKLLKCLLLLYFRFFRRGRTQGRLVGQNHGKISF